MKTQDTSWGESITESFGSAWDTVTENFSILNLLPVTAPAAMVADVVNVDLLEAAGEYARGMGQTAAKFLIPAAVLGAAYLWLKAR